MNVSEKKQQLFESIKSAYSVIEMDDKVTFNVEGFNVDVCVCAEANMVLIELSRGFEGVISKDYSKLLNIINTTTKTSTHTVVNGKLYTCRSMLEMNMLIPINKFQQTLSTLLYKAITVTMYIEKFRKSDISLT